jgi:hypothetical protein
MPSTLKNAKDYGINTFVGLTTCDCRFTNMVNEAQQRLLNCGRWWGTYKRIRICVRAGCIVWPREVSAIDAIQLCRENLPIRNAWYEFLGDVIPPALGTCCNDRMNLLDRGTVSIPINIATTGNYIAVYPSTSSDVGKKILFQGTDQNGVTVRSSTTGIWVDGEYLTIASPFNQTATRWLANGITGIQKPVTNGALLVYEYNGVDAPGTLLATLQPSETNTVYRQTFINNLPANCCPQPCAPCNPAGDGCAPALPDCTTGGLTVTAIARMEFIPARVDSDWLIIGNLAALKAEMRSIYLENTDEQSRAEIEHKKALRFLREELDTKVGTRERVTANVDIWGTAKLSRVMHGFI